jgi:hypothetical protein
MCAGVETLVKMAGKDAAVPEYELSGPTFEPDTSSHVVKCIIKRGSFKLSLVMEFVLIDGKIVLLSNSRA